MELVLFAEPPFSTCYTHMALIYQIFIFGLLGRRGAKKGVNKGVFIISRAGVEEVAVLSSYVTKLFILGKTNFLPSQLEVAP